MLTNMRDCESSRALIADMDTTASFRSRPGRRDFSGREPRTELDQAPSLGILLQMAGDGCRPKSNGEIPA
jgi:hypothetical protein